MPGRVKQKLDGLKDLWEATAGEGPPPLGDLQRLYVYMVYERERERERGEICIIRIYYVPC